MFYWVLVQYVSVPLSIWTLFLGRSLWSDPKEQRRCGMNLHNTCCALRFTAKRDCQCTHGARNEKRQHPFMGLIYIVPVTLGVHLSCKPELPRHPKSQPFLFIFPRFIFSSWLLPDYGDARVKYKRLFSIYFQSHWSDDKQPMDIQVDCDEISSLVCSLLTFTSTAMLQSPHLTHSLTSSILKNWEALIKPIRREECNSAYYTSLCKLVQPLLDGLPIHPVQES